MVLAADIGELLVGFQVVDGGDDRLNGLDFALVLAPKTSASMASIIREGSLKRSAATILARVGGAGQARF